MPFPRHFTSLDNFELAFSRIIRGQNKEYKNFYRHLYPSYQLALRDNLEDLIDDVKRARYEPQPASCVYQPKKSGVLRPLRLLSLQDQIIYQAIANEIAIAFRRIQDKHAFTRCFGAIAADKYSPFFYRGWRSCYRKFDKALVKAFEAGNEFVADFDLVSFFELIDHKLLREVLEKKLRQPEILDLLFRCLEKWTENHQGSCLHHGIPQGPEPSAFLAECFLFSFDDLPFKKVIYLRYVDDIRLMSKTEAPVRRALLKLDIESKQVGLVPQAQKIECRRISNINELRKNIPSNVVSLSKSRTVTTASQKRLERIFNGSMRKEDGRWIIIDVTKFKFALFRMRPKTAVLRKVARFLDTRSDLSWLFASYFRRFPKNQIAADALLVALQQDPTYDAAAANYIEAMDECEPDVHGQGYRRAIRTAEGRSEEKSLLLKVAATTFRGRRSGPKDALKLINNLEQPLAKSLVLHRLFGRNRNAPFKVADAVSVLDDGTRGSDADLARFCVDLLLEVWPWTKRSWTPSKNVHHAVKVFLKRVGLRKRGPTKKSVLEKFFEDRMKIRAKLNWRKALGANWCHTEQRCLRLQQFEIGDPTPWVMLLDTFNEDLVNSLSLRHSTLKARFKKLAGKHAQPDFGVWLHEPLLATVLPKHISWFQEVHSARLTDMAHAKSRKGVPTKPVRFRTRDKLRKRSQQAWAELILEWRKIV